MKVWEVIKELTEDPTKVYKNDNGYSVKFTNEGILAWVDDSGKYKTTFTVNTNITNYWHLVRQPVTWQEAIQAWADGKKVSYSYMGYDKRFPFEDSNTMMSIEKLKNAEWYMEH